MNRFSTLLLLLTFMSCGPELPDTQTIVDELYAKKKAVFVSKKLSDCKLEAIEAAEAHVDSIVHQLLNADLVDRIVFPVKPSRPEAPDHIIGTVKRWEQE